MRRQILSVIVGVLLSYLATALAGYSLYHFSAHLYLSKPLVGRYLISPCVALLVGACVAALAPSRSTALTILSLAPWTAGLLIFAQKQGVWPTLETIFLILVYMIVGVAAAKLVTSYRQGRARVTS